VFERKAAPGRTIARGRERNDTKGKRGRFSGKNKVLKRLAF